jgi:hypothetical protein
MAFISPAQSAGIQHDEDESNEQNDESTFFLLLA